MRDAWYADNRDVIKWGTLVHLAKRHHIRTILQVAFFRSQRALELLSDREDVGIPEEVWDHFRDVRQVKRLEERCGLKIEVLDLPFTPRLRANYMDVVVQVISNRRGAKIVLLDPDTGIERQSAPQKHVKVGEVQQVWRVLRTGDWLVLYQHKSRTPDWLRSAKRKFATACSPARVSTFSSPRIAPDVVFFATAKRHD